MPRIDLPLGLKGSAHLPRTKQRLVNCFNNQEGQIIGRRGIQNISSNTGPARGIFVWNENLYIVDGTDLLKVTNVEGGEVTNLGTITGSGNVQTAVGFNHAVIVDPGGEIFSLSKTDVLTTISSEPNFEACVDVCHIDGRFVYIPSSGDPAFFSDIGAAATVQSDSFFDAEELPDKNNACENLRNTLYIFGTDSVELFRDIGTDPNPFGRIQGARIDNGYIGGLMEYSDTLVYVGREKGQTVGIFGLEGGSARRLSNEFVDDILEGYDPAILADAIPVRMKMRGYDLAIWILRDDTFGLYKGEWFELDTVIDGISSTWDGGFIVAFNNVYYSANGSDFGKIAEINKDNGNDITRIIDTSFNDPEGRWLSAQYVELGISQGENAGPGSVALIMSRDNKAYPNPMYRDLGGLAEYNSRLIWRPPGGLGAYQGFFGMRIYTTEDVIFDTDSLIVGLSQ